jgi:hypothetical protein
MSLQFAALQTTSWMIAGFVVALILMVLIVGPGFDYARDTWRHYKKQRSHGYSRLNALRLAIDCLNWRI